MKAVLMTAPGEPEVLQLGDIPKPPLTTRTQLQVRLKAAGINPVDTKLRARGTYYPDRLPCVLGCDGAGIVEAVGADVQRFAPGDEVYFCHGGIGGAQGNYAQYTVLDEAWAAAKPASLSFTEAAAVPLALITAWESLYDRADGLRPGQSVLVHAGAGGVGHLALQLAKQAGCRVCTTVGDDAKAAMVQDLGADEVIDYRSRDFAAGTLAWSDGMGVDIAFDTVGGATFQTSFAAVRHYGDLVTLLQPGPDTDWKIARLRNLRIGLELMLTPMAEDLDTARRHQAWILDQGAALFEAGKLRIHLGRTLPLAQAGEAHHMIQRGGMLGKAVLEIPW